MRVRVHLESEKAISLPWNYPEWLMGLFYRWVNAGNLALGYHLHEKGFSVEGHRYKLYTFSWLFGKQLRATAQGLVLHPPLTWYVSSPLPAIIEAFVQGLWKEPEVSLGRHPVTVSRTELLSEVLPEGPALRIRTLSPILVSTREVREGDATPRKVFLAPDHPAFSRILTENLRRKLQALQHPPVEGQLQLIPLRTRSRLLTLHGTHLRAYEGTFVCEGPPKLLLLAYQAGLGERTGQGFGMVEVLAPPPSSKKRHPSSKPT